jgi:cytochrome c-type biogenesis protein CcmH/NrfG
MASLATEAAPAARWQARQVYAMAVICLVLGVLLGYLFRGSASKPPAKPLQATAQPGADAHLQMPSLDQMKHMADKKAEPLLKRLQADPKNADLLLQLARIYRSTHQFQDAAGYYDRSLQVTPDHVAVRNEYASCLYYAGDADGAIGQFQQTLQTDAKNPEALFNLGVIKWKSKNDPNGALSSWRQLLKSNPHLEPDKRAQVEKLIAQVKSGPAAAKPF